MPERLEQRQRLQKRATGEHLPGIVALKVFERLGASNHDPKIALPRGRALRAFGLHDRRRHDRLSMADFGERRHPCGRP
jgi:hypothetical protein